MQEVMDEIIMEKYPVYKDSGESWIGEIPSHWEIKKLKYLFQEKKHTLNPDLSCGSISFGEVIKKDDEKIPLATKASYQEVLKGEFLINPLNLNYDLISLRIALSNINVVVSPGYIVLKDIEQLSKRYFRYLLYRYDVAYMKLLGSGVRQTISFNHIANSLLPFPSLKEQTAIANFLDTKTAQINKTIAQKEKLIELLKERRQILIHNAVTKGLNTNVRMKNSGVEWIGEIPESWEVKKLKTFASFVNRGSTPNYVDDSKIKVINQATFSRSYFDFENIKFTKHTYDEYAFNKGKVLKDDLLMASTGGGVLGKVAFFDLDDKEENCIADSHVTIIRTDGLINKFYFYFFEINFDLINGLLAQGSTNQTELQRDWLRDFLLPVPNKKEQERIVQHIDIVANKTATAIKSKLSEIEKLKEYKATLINAAVTGKIKVC